MIKRFFFLSTIFLLSQNLIGCTTNPATGENQFAALMSPQQELRVGAQEHAKIMKQYGVYENKALQNYVSNIGKKVVKHTERPEVSYKFFLLDSPMVNAFALPGGYIYITRGLLALSNSEAEMASVLAHETGHITARHSAERYSRGVVTSLGAMILASAVGSDGAAQALGVGSDLYIKSYSRSQESQADSLGIRYLSRSGYTPTAMAGFLTNLQADSALEAQIDGRDASVSASYFSTHPATKERVAKAINQARQYSPQGIVNHDKYLRMLNNMIYGDSVEQGFVRDNNFYHPELGFKFSVPNGYKLINQPSQVIASSKNGAVIIFDLASSNNNAPMEYIKNIWMKGKKISGAENISINSMAAATASFNGSVNGRVMQVRLIAIRWSDTQIARFQIAIPNSATVTQIKALKKTTYSFKRIGDRERRSLQPYRINIITSKLGDSVVSLSRRMAQSDYKEQRFRVLNGLKPHEEITANRLYKIVID